MNEIITLCLEIIFWFALFIVFYTYLGYGIVLYVLVKLKELFVKPVGDRRKQRRYERTTENPLAGKSDHTLPTPTTG